MKFPGSKLLHRFDLVAQRSSLEDLLRSSRASGFTGLVEVAHEGATGLIFYYLGAEVNAIYRQGASSLNGQTALERMRSLSTDAGGTVSVYELPLDMAHLHAWAHQAAALGGPGAQSRRARRAPAPPGEDRAHRNPRDAVDGGRGDGAARARPRLQRVLRGRERPHLREGCGAHEARGGHGPRPSPKLFLADFSRDAWKIAARGAGAPS